MAISKTLNALLKAPSTLKRLPESQEPMEPDDYSAMSSFPTSSVGSGQSVENGESEESEAIDDEGTIKGDSAMSISRSVFHSSFKTEEMTTLNPNFIPLGRSTPNC